jgi:hypothetical protein
MSDTLQNAKQAAGEGTDTHPELRSQLSLQDDAQMVVSVQVSQRLHPQLFDDLARAKKRERAERLRWLCQYGLAAERQTMVFAHRASDGVLMAQHDFTQSTPRRESQATQSGFTLPTIKPLVAASDNEPSLVSHPDVAHLLL